MRGWRSALRTNTVFIGIHGRRFLLMTPDSKKHFGEIMKSVSELKKYGKKIAPRNGGSIFVRDRRL